MDPILFRSWVFLIFGSCWHWGIIYQCFLWKHLCLSSHNFSIFDCSNHFGSLFFIFFGLIVPKIIFHNQTQFIPHSGVFDKHNFENIYPLSWIIFNSNKIIVRFLIDYHFFNTLFICYIIIIIIFKMLIKWKFTCKHIVNNYSKRPGICLEIIS